MQTTELPSLGPSHVLHELHTKLYSPVLESAWFFVTDLFFFPSTAPSNGVIGRNINTIGYKIYNMGQNVNVEECPFGCQ